MGNRQREECNWKGHTASKMQTAEWSSSLCSSKSHALSKEGGGGGGEAYDPGGPEKAARASGGCWDEQAPRTHLPQTSASPRPRAPGSVQSCDQTQHVPTRVQLLFLWPCMSPSTQGKLTPPRILGPGDVAVFTEDSGQPVARLIPSRRASCSLRSKDGLESRAPAGAASDPTPPRTSSPPVAASPLQGPPRGAGPQAKQLRSKPCHHRPL